MLACVSALCSGLSLTTFIGARSGYRHEWRKSCAGSPVPHLLRSSWTGETFFLNSPRPCIANVDLECQQDCWTLPAIQHSAKVVPGGRCPCSRTPVTTSKTATSLPFRVEQRPLPRRRTSCPRTKCQNSHLLRCAPSARCSRCCMYSHLILLAGIEGMEALNDAPPMEVKVLNVPDS